MKFRSIFFAFPLAVCLLAQQSPTPAPSPAKAAPKKATPAKAAPAKPSPSTPAAAPAPPQPTAAAPAAAATAGKPVLTVGDEKITAEEFDAMIELLPEQYRAHVRGPGKREFAEQVVRLKVFSAEARKRGLDKDPKIAGQIDFQIQNVLAGALFQKLSAEKAGDPAALQQYFAEHKSEFDQVKARHILVRFQGSPVPVKDGKPDLSDMQALLKAGELKKRVTGGEKFEDLAKAESDDTGSGAQGGDLGTFKRGMMVPAFEAVAFALPAGHLSDPVRTQFGYHIIEVQERKDAKFDDVKPEIEKRLGPEHAKKVVEDLRKATNVVMDETFFPAPAPAQPMPGTPAVAPPK